MLVLDLNLKNMILSLSLGLILSSSLAWIMNQAELKILYFITSSGLNIICRLVSSSSQGWTFYFCCWAELEHSLLNKARLVYSLSETIVFANFQETRINKIKFLNSGSNAKSFHIYHKNKLRKTKFSFKISTYT